MFQVFDCSKPAVKVLQVTLGRLCFLVPVLVVLRSNTETRLITEYIYCECHSVLRKYDFYRGLRSEKHFQSCLLSQKIR